MPYRLQLDVHGVWYNLQAYGVNQNDVPAERPYSKIRVFTEYDKGYGKFSTDVRPASAG